MVIYVAFLRASDSNYPTIGLDRINQYRARLRRNGDFKPSRVNRYVLLHLLTFRSKNRSVMRFSSFLVLSDAKRSIGLTTAFYILSVTAVSCWSAPRTSYFRSTDWKLLSLCNSRRSFFSIHKGFSDIRRNCAVKRLSAPLFINEVFEE